MGLHFSEKPLEPRSRNGSFLVLRAINKYSVHVCEQEFDGWLTTNVSVNVVKWCIESFTCLRANLAFVLADFDDFIQVRSE
eukprot:CAMPEP_0201538208 /NCGR_PEP_ID=MMETSP0161_2-20130828/66988_1 /ASSEMBLY_ACC=CAM_ASM_000251 /TAXON_ID=180227 /ORGANISM="Neoparamoeba aestuarina, Strain SoJaBio B1-5/56/2" /LENGTH=80 /DNA_ID=CAMNT_0047944931 /DNA_START=366 /DNA_END=608 /DNA_ORIENTATION=+